MSSEEMIRMLQENALYEVPAHMTITLQQWEEQAASCMSKKLRCFAADPRMLRKPCLEMRSAFHFSGTALAAPILLFCVNMLHAYEMLGE